MCFTTKRMTAGALALAACILVPATAMAGVVVSASGPSAGDFPVGRKIGDSEQIVLRAGDTLTVLDGSGTRVLRGAGTYSLDQQSGPSKRSTFAVLTERRSAQRMRTGAVRNVEGETPVHSPNLWYVDVAGGGTMCLAGTDRVRLWRGSAEGDATYYIGSADGRSQTVEFADGEMLAPWDTETLPVAGETDYRITGSDNTGETAVRFVVLEAVAGEPEALAGQLIENGCTKQLELLSTAMMLAEG